MLSRSGRIAALLVFLLAALLFAGCGEDEPAEEKTAPEDEEFTPPTKFDATRDLLGVTGYVVSTENIGPDEIPSLLTEGDGEIYDGAVLVFEAAEVEDLSEAELVDLAEEEFGTDSSLGDPDDLGEESCGRYRVIGPGDDLQDSVIAVLCG
ncbi:MAG TPA: hypothetical protein VD766_07050 [Solirubrobacterales bacterium]|nr:hypothetical protein [Solirubrobacterales bacterium]